MGAVTSLVTQVVGFATKIKKEQDSDALEEKRDEVEKLQHPITPPFFYQERSIRDDKLIHNHPYSVKSIVTALNKGIIPTGYSIEQLRNIGFEKEVASFVVRRRKERDDIAKNLKESVIKLKGMIVNGFPEVDELTRNTIKRGNIFNNMKIINFLNTIESILSQPDPISKIDTQTVDNLIELLNTKSGLLQDSLDIKKQTDQLRQQISDAEQQRTDATLKVIRRALVSKVR